MKKINIAIVGLSFGGSFVPIYQDHPDVNRVGLCDLNSDLMDRFTQLYGIPDHYLSLDEVLADDTIDAVHLVTPIPQHAEQIIKVLRSGRDCACTVPMALSHEDARRIMEAIRESGRRFMLMETTRSLFETAHVYKEGFNIYGSKKSFEWGFYDGSKPYITTLEGLADLAEERSRSGSSRFASASGK